MPKIQYKDIAFEAGTKAIITSADEIVTAYQAQGYDLTLRQLYYQFVARGLLANSPEELHPACGHHQRCPAGGPP